MVAYNPQIPVGHRCFSHDMSAAMSLILQFLKLWLIPFKEIDSHRVNFPQWHHSLWKYWIIYGTDGEWSDYNPWIMWVEALWVWLLQLLLLISIWIKVDTWLFMSCINIPFSPLDWCTTWGQQSCEWQSRSSTFSGVSCVNEVRTWTCWELTFFHREMTFTCRCLPNL